jgi:serine-type D-Ala-D-Ala carboxypeptidase/endopeptidase
MNNPYSSSQSGEVQKIVGAQGFAPSICTTAEQELLYVDYRAQEMHAALGELTLVSEPGQRYEYSNFGMGLLGHLLSRKTSQPYEELVQQIICRPLGMENTAIHLTPQQQQCLTSGHSPDGVLAINWDFDVMAPAGGLRSTVEDLLLFLKAHLYPANSPMEAMLERSQESYFTNDTLRIGLAWHINTLPTGQVMHWHNGGTSGYVSFIGFNKIIQTGIVVLSNYGDILAGDYSVDAMAVKILMEISAP